MICIWLRGVWIGVFGYVSPHFLHPLRVMNMLTLQQIWDLRTGSIHDAFAYDAPITSLQFDTRRIVAAAGEPVVKVYDKADGRHWNVGSGAGSGENGDPVVWEDEFHQKLSVVERVRVKDGFLVEGRKDGTVGLWSC